MSAASTYPAQRELPRKGRADAIKPRENRMAIAPIQRLWRIRAIGVCRLFLIFLGELVYSGSCDLKLSLFHKA